MLRLAPVVVSFICGLFLFLGPFDYFASSGLPVIARLLTIVCIYLVTDTIVRSVNHNTIVDKIEKQGSEITSLLKSDFHVSHVGRSDVANKVVSDKIISKASQVLNTIIASDIDFVSREKHEVSAAEVYTKMLARNDANNWYDIVSEELKDLPRYEYIEKSKLRAGKFHKYVVSTGAAVPLINFVIIEYPEGEQEVYFGWLYSEVEGLSDIFQSSDHRLVALFRSYFNALQFHSGR